MVLIIHAHPSPESFTCSLANAAALSLRSSGVETHVTDLYRLSAENSAGSPGPFPPILDDEELRRKTSFEPVVQRQMDLVEKAAGYVVIHPDWWGGPPAVLKGWVDRVLRPGTAYETPDGFGKQEPVGLLAGRKAVLAVHGDGDDPGPLEEFWVRRIWGFCGVEAGFLYLPRINECGRVEREGFTRILCRRVLEEFPVITS